MEAESSASFTITCDIAIDTEPETSGFKGFAGNMIITPGTYNSGDSLMQDIKLHFHGGISADQDVSCYSADEDGNNFNASPTIKLDVIEVSLSVKDNYKEIKQGTSATLVCAANGLSDEADFEWRDGNDQKVEVDVTPLADSTQLSVWEVTPTKDTTYKCIVSGKNEANTIEKTVTVRVLEEDDEDEIDGNDGNNHEEDYSSAQLPKIGVLIAGALIILRI